MDHIGDGNIVIHCKLNNFLTTLVNISGASIGTGKNDGNKTCKKKFFNEHKHCSIGKIPSSLPQMLTYFSLSASTNLDTGFPTARE